MQGLKYKASVGLEVDKQQITIAARPTDLVNGSPFLNALRDGAFDGAIVQRDRVFMSALGQTPIGGVTLFHGRVSTVDQVGRTSATITVASDLVVLDYDMPRNLYSPTCLHTLYDSGCGVVRGTYAASGTVGAGSTASLINFSGALASHAQGSIVFTSGVNANLRATVKSVAAGASLIADVSPALAAGDGRRASPSTPAATIRRRPVRRAFPISPISAASPSCRRRRSRTERSRGFPAEREERRSKRAA